MQSKSALKGCRRQGLPSTPPWAESPPGVCSAPSGSFEALLPAGADMEVSIDSTPKGLPSFDALFESALEEEGRCSKTLSLSDTSMASSSVDFLSLSLSSQGSGLGLTPQPSAELSLSDCRHASDGLARKNSSFRPCAKVQAKRSNPFTASSREKTLQIFSIKSLTPCRGSLGLSQARPGGRDQRLGEPP